MKNIVPIIVLFLVIQGCIEPFEAETLGFEGTLVVDAKLTNEEKRHQVLLSRARPFDKDSITPETDAKIVMKDDLGEVFEFEEVQPGTYRSVSMFQAEEDIKYELNISTTDGTSFFSEKVQVPKSEQLGEWSFERNLNNKGKEGVSVFLYDTGLKNSPFRRFEYEETFKIIAPSYSAFEFELEEDGIVNGFRVVRVKPRVQNVSTCYRTNLSTEIILLNTAGLEENNASRFELLFLNRNDYIISHRYSVLIKQFSLTSEAYSYYRQLNDFSSSESVFSEIQPGFLQGNIRSSSDESIDVLGYFEVSKVNEKRIYFNYEDLFPGEPLPPFVVDCELISAPYTGKATRIVLDGENVVLGPNDILVLSDDSANTELTEGIKNNLFTFWGVNDDFIEEDKNSEDGFSTIPPYYTKFITCGDCTVLGSTEVPDFWTE